MMPGMWVKSTGEQQTSLPVVSMILPQNESLTVELRSIMRSVGSEVRLIRHISPGNRQMVRGRQFLEQIIKPILLGARIRKSGKCFQSSVRKRHASANYLSASKIYKAADN